MALAPELLERGPGWLRAWLAELLQFCIETQPLPSETCDVHDGPNGRQIVPRFDGATGNGGSASRHPFQLLDASDNDGPKLKVSLDSWLMNSIRASDKLTIVGLGEPFTIAVNQAVWIAVKYLPSSPDIEEITIEHGNFNSGNWGNYDDPISWDAAEAPNRAQTCAYRLIGYTQPMTYTTQPTGDPADFPERLVLGEGGAQMQVVQCLRTNLILCETCVPPDASGTPYTGMILSDYSHTPAPPPAS